MTMLAIAQTDSFIGVSRSFAFHALSLIDSLFDVPSLARRCKSSKRRLSGQAVTQGSDGSAATGSSGYDAANRYLLSSFE
jgi:hypothetical protein